MKNDCELRMDPIMDFEGLHCFACWGERRVFLPIYLLLAYRQSICWINDAQEGKTSLV